MTAARMQQRRDTAANWTAANPVLADGEIGLESDTGALKIGDGSTAWNALDTFSPGASVLAQTVYTENGQIAFTAQFNTAIIQGDADAMGLLPPSTPADNGKRVRVIKEKVGQIKITFDVNNVQSGDGGGNLIVGNTYTIKDDTACAPIDFEANNGRWIADGFPQFYGYGFISTE